MKLCIMLFYNFMLQAKTGTVLNILGVGVSTLATLTWGTAIFGLDDFQYNVTTAVNNITSTQASNLTYIGQLWTCLVNITLSVRTIIAL